MKNMPIIIAIRHGFSKANNRENIGTLAFGAKNAPLEEEGRRQARQRGSTLPAEYGIIPKVTTAAVSHLLRTKQTAKEMGFLRTKPYELLNEVEHDLELSVFSALRDRGELPPLALAAAEAILKNPPRERVWVTHGLVIAGLTQVLGVARQYERLIPRFCEARAFSI